MNSSLRIYSKLKSFINLKLGQLKSTFSFFSIIIKSFEAAILRNIRCSGKVFLDFFHTCIQLFVWDVSIAVFSKMKKEYSLWMRPSIDTEGKLKDLISNAAHTFKTDPFVPHATLVGSISHLDIYSILSICETIATQGHAFDVNVDSVETGKLYYRSVYARLQKSKALMDLRTKAMRLFGLEESDKKPFVPHTSIREFLFDFFVAFILRLVSESVVYSDCAESEKVDYSKAISDTVKNIGTLKIDRLDLWTTYGPYRTWECLGTWILPIQ